MGVISAVIGQLGWKNYGNGHTIFDASEGTSPDGTVINNTNPANTWSATYPTLMGWNGQSTYGVRVDVSRVSDYATTAGSAPANGGTSNSVVINYGNDANSTYQMLWGSGNVVYGTAGIYCNPATDALTASGFFNSSDSRLKTILKMDGDVAYFKWKDGRDNKTHIGYIAQEVRKANPDQVQKGEDKMLSVNYVEILVEKIRILEKRIIELEKR